MNTSMHPGYTKDTINLILRTVLKNISLSDGGTDGTEGSEGVGRSDGESRLS